MFVQTVVAATVVPYVIRQHYAYNFEGGSRYSAMPIMSMTAAAVAAVDAPLHRQATGRGGDRIPLVRQSPRALVAVATLPCVLALGWLLDYRYVTGRTSVLTMSGEICPRPWSGMAYRKVLPGWFCSSMIPALRWREASCTGCSAPSTRHARA